MSKTARLRQDAWYTLHSYPAAEMQMSYETWGDLHAPALYGVRPQICTKKDDISIPVYHQQRNLCIEIQQAIFQVNRAIKGKEQLQGKHLQVSL